MSDNKSKLNKQLAKIVMDDSLTDEVRLKKVKYLIYLGANANQKVNGKSLLKIAREKGYKEIENVIKESLVKSFKELIDGDKYEKVLNDLEEANRENVDNSCGAKKRFNGKKIRVNGVEIVMKDNVVLSSPNGASTFSSKGNDIDGLVEDILKEGQALQEILTKRGRDF